MNQTSTSTRPTGVNEFLLALNIFLSITASLGNTLILVALRKASFLYPPTKRLFRCLAVTDLCVGLITQPVFVALLISFLTTAQNIKVALILDSIRGASSFILCQVSIFISTAISVDRLFALSLGLRYRHVVTLRRVRALVIFFWLIGVSCACLSALKKSFAFTVALTLITLSIATSVFSYTKIYRMLRHYHLQVHVPRGGQPNGEGFPLNIARYKKSVASILWVQLALVACYVPFIVVVSLMTYRQMYGSEFQIAFYFAVTFVYLNSSLNPILYCWKIRAVRQAVKDTIKQLHCLL